MCGTKVNDFDGSFILEVHKNIFRFQVSMANFLIMTVANCLEDLFNDDSGLSFCKLFSLSDLFK